MEQFVYRALTLLCPQRSHRTPEYLKAVVIRIQNRPVCEVEEFVIERLSWFGKRSRPARLVI